MTKCPKCERFALWMSCFPSSNAGECDWGSRMKWMLVLYNESLIQWLQNAKKDLEAKNQVVLPKSCQ